MKRLPTPLLAAFLALAALTSCATRTQVEYVDRTEYVPVYIDITDVVDPVLRFRPDNSIYEIKTGTNLKTTFDIIDNSNQYLRAWEDWEHYASALEDTLKDIRDKSKGEDPTLADVPQAPVEPEASITDARS